MKPIDHFQVAAPTRADLAGGTLDLWPLYCFTGTAKTINVALSLQALVDFEVHSSPTCKVEVSSGEVKSHLFYEPVQGEALHRVPPSVRFPVHVISQSLLAHSKLPSVHLKISIHTQAPQKSGLGGSSTLCVALARGMNRVFGELKEQGWQWKLLDWVKDSEAMFLRTPTGTQDYLAALFGGLRCYQYALGQLTTHAYENAVMEELGKRLIVIFSGEEHHSGISNWELYKKAVEGDRSVLNGLDHIRRIADDLDQELRASLCSWTRVGKLLDEEWHYRRETFQVHTPKLDELINVLKGQRVLGAKVCGAAQGGSLIALIEPDRKDALCADLRKRGVQVLEAQPQASGVFISSL